MQIKSKEANRSNSNDHQPVPPPCTHVFSSSRVNCTDPTPSSRQVAIAHVYCTSASHCSRKTIPIPPYPGQIIKVIKPHAIHTK